MSLIAGSELSISGKNVLLSCWLHGTRYAHILVKFSFLFIAACFVWITGRKLCKVAPSDLSYSCMITTVTLDFYLQL